MVMIQFIDVGCIALRVTAGYRWEVCRITQSLAVSFGNLGIPQLV